MTHENLLHSIIRFKPNIRFEPASATTGYTWGKPAPESNILKTCEYDPESLNDIPDDAIVAERWMCTDDRQFPSLAFTAEFADQPTPFFELLEAHPIEMLGALHTEKYGPYLGVIMKLLDTNAITTKGSLSVQVHPKPGHPTRPSKPEMWKSLNSLTHPTTPNQNSVYLGWKQPANPESLRQAVAKGTLEQLLNLLTLTPESLVLVAGGMIHAVRANSFLAEWSKAPDAIDIQKGNIKDATVAPYDRTDGKIPRPGKEDVESTIEIMNHAGAFGASAPSSLLTNPELLSKDKHNNTHEALFRTTDVWVDQYQVTTTTTLDVSQHGLPLYLESGHGTISYIHNNSQYIEELSAGEELFLPASLKKITIKAGPTEPIIFQTWWRP